MPQPERVHVKLRVLKALRAELGHQNRFFVAICGSTIQLGDRDPFRGPRAQYLGEDTWEKEIWVDEYSTIEYKWMVVDLHTNNVSQMEMLPYRTVRVGTNKLIIHNTFSATTCTVTKLYGDVESGRMYECQQDQPPCNAYPCKQGRSDGLPAYMCPHDLSLKQQASNDQFPIAITESDILNDQLSPCGKSLLSFCKNTDPVNDPLFEIALHEIIDTGTGQPLCERFPYIHETDISEGSSSTESLPETPVQETVQTTENYKSDSGVDGVIELPKANRRYSKLRERQHSNKRSHSEDKHSKQDGDEADKDRKSPGNLNEFNKVFSEIKNQQHRRSFSEGRTHTRDVSKPIENELIRRFNEMNKIRKHQNTPKQSNDDSKDPIQDVSTEEENDRLNDVSTKPLESKHEEKMTCNEVICDVSESISDLKQSANEIYKVLEEQDELKEKLPIQEVTTSPAIQESTAEVTGKISKVKRQIRALSQSYSECNIQPVATSTPKASESAVQYSEVSRSCVEINTPAEQRNVLKKSYSEIQAQTPNVTRAPNDLANILPEMHRELSRKLKEIGTARIKQNSPKQNSPKQNSPRCARNSPKQNSPRCSRGKSKPYKEGPYNDLNSKSMEIHSELTRRFIEITKPGEMPSVLKHRHMEAKIRAQKEVRAYSVRVADRGWYERPSKFQQIKNAWEQNAANKMGLAFEDESSGHDLTRSFSEIRDYFNRDKICRIINKKNSKRQRQVECNYRSQVECHYRRGMHDRVSDFNNGNSCPTNAGPMPPGANKNYGHRPTREPCHRNGRYKIHTGVTHTKPAVNKSLPFSATLNVGGVIYRAITKVSEALHITSPKPSSETDKHEEHSGENDDTESSTSEISSSGVSTCSYSTNPSQISVSTNSLNSDFTDSSLGSSSNNSENADEAEYNLLGIVVPRTSAADTHLADTEYRNTIINSIGLHQPRSRLSNDSSENADTGQAEELDIAVDIDRSSSDENTNNSEGGDSSDDDCNDSTSGYEAGYNDNIDSDGQAESSGSDCNSDFTQNSGYEALNNDNIGSDGQPDSDCNRNFTQNSDYNESTCNSGYEAENNDNSDSDGQPDSIDGEAEDIGNVGDPNTTCDTDQDICQLQAGLEDTEAEIDMNDNADDKRNNQDDTVGNAEAPRTACDELASTEDGFKQTGDDVTASGGNEAATDPAYQYDPSWSDKKDSEQNPSPSDSPRVNKDTVRVEDETVKGNGIGNAQVTTNKDLVVVDTSFGLRRRRPSASADSGSDDENGTGGDHMGGEMKMCCMDESTEHRQSQQTLMLMVNVAMFVIAVGTGLMLLHHFWE